MADDASTIHYPFRFDPWFERVAWPLGIRPDTTGLAIEAEHLVVRFGPWQVVTPLSNVAGALVTGPYAWPKVVGPPHVSLSDGGLTFATNAEQGTCIRFRRPVSGSTPLPLPRHGTLTVTVDGAESLAEALTEVDSLLTARSVEEAAEEIEDELAGATASELRQRARALGVPGVSSMRKAELVEALRPHVATGEPAS